MAMTAAEVLKMVKDNEVKFVDFRFADQVTKAVVDEKAFAIDALAGKTNVPGIFHPRRAGVRRGGFGDPPPKTWVDPGIHLRSRG